MTSDQNTAVGQSSGQFLGSFADSNDYAENVLRAVLQATKSANEIPSSGEDYEYYSSFASFRQVMLAEGKDILKLISSLSSQQIGKGKFEGLDLEEKFDLLIDVNDAVLERVGNHLDEADGVKKKPDDVVMMTVSTSRPIHTSWNKKLSQDSKSSGAQYHLLAARNVVRPQLTFREKIDNSNSAFVPIIRDKPHSIKPLAVLLETDGDQESFSHPYECEIDHFEPTEQQLQVEEQQVPPLPLEETPYFFVDTIEQLREMNADLCKQSEIAVDLEHHSYRTFQGFTCLMQISTRSTDYVVDTLSLRHELHLLNEVFADPKIVKVFHGADMDVVWLQRDFGLYLVGLFDTGQAARVLGMAHLSLAFLLKHYCRLEADKKFQLADWRIRPLPQEMIKYAREDTHYLLHVYDLMKQDLMNKGNQLQNLLRSVFQRSKQVCLKRYEKPLLHEDSYLDLYRKSKKTFNSKQLYALKHLYAWRDGIARLEDESTGYVLPNHMILQISEILPREQQGIVACCNPCPPLVRQNLNELHSIILKARDVPLNQKQGQASEVQLEPAETVLDLDSVLYSVHDLFYHRDATLSLPTILDDAGDLHLESGTGQVKRAPWKAKPLFAAFVEVPKVSTTPARLRTRRSDAGLVLPYQRYKAALTQETSDAGTEDKAVTDAERVTRIEKHLQAVMEEASGSNDNAEVLEEQPPVPFEDSELATPLRPQKQSRGARKRKKAAPDVSLNASVVTDPQHHPAKKTKVDDARPSSSIDQEAEGDTFKPFDYAACLEKEPTKKRSKKWNYNPEQQDEMKPGKKKGKRQQVKSHTFGDKRGGKTPGGKGPQR